MEWYHDSFACLDVAKTMISDVEELQKESVYNSDVIPYLKVSIKNTLENCRSPLDYAANHINSQYPKFNSRYKRVQFPILYNQKNAQFKIKESLKCSPSKDIMDVIKESQFKKDWLINLTKLVNLNKHNNLTHHDATNISKIDYMIIDDKPFMNNVIFGGNDIDVQIGNKSFTGPEMLNIHPGITGSFSRTYYFKDLDNKEIISTLKNIVKETENVIIRLKKVIERD